MGSLKKYLLLLLSINVVQLNAQTFADTTIPENKVLSIVTPVNDFEVDNLNNIYLINKNNQIKKLNEKGDSVGVYNDIKRFGDISSVDVTSPLKILVYYKDFASIVVLDRLLAVRATIELRKNIMQPGAIALSYDNNIWVYDEAESKIKKVDEAGNVLQTSNDLRLTFTESLQITDIIDDNSVLYLYDKAQGWLLFDYYFTYKKKVVEPGLTDVQVINSTMTGRKNADIYLMKENEIIAKKISCTYCTAYISKTIYTPFYFYLLNKEGLNVYRIKQ